jgi:hypothetical protein
LGKENLVLTYLEISPLKRRISHQNGYYTRCIDVLHLETRNKMDFKTNCELGKFIVLFKQYVLRERQLFFKQDGLSDDDSKNRILFKSNY